jgi:hypothetical protein
MVIAPSSSVLVANGEACSLADAAWTEERGAMFSNQE